MNFSEDLLEQADHLLQREIRKPKQASLRRATSNAYYALFHHLCFEAVALIAPRLSREAVCKLQRTITHDAVKQVCARFLQTPSPAPLRILLDAKPSTDLRFVALTFLELQDARHSADYDMNSHWIREESRRHVKIARDACSRLESIRTAPDTNLFLVSFLVAKAVEAVR